MDDMTPRGVRPPRFVSRARFPVRMHCSINARHCIEIAVIRRGTSAASTRSNSTGALPECFAIRLILLRKSVRHALRSVRTFNNRELRLSKIIAVLQPGFSYFG
jgi:hypothetical protein